MQGARAPATWRPTVARVPAEQLCQGAAACSATMLSHIRARVEGMCTTLHDAKGCDDAVVLKALGMCDLVTRQLRSLRLSYTQRTLHPTLACPSPLVVVIFTALALWRRSLRAVLSIVLDVPRDLVRVYRRLLRLCRLAHVAQHHRPDVARLQIADCMRNTSHQ